MKRRWFILATLLIILTFTISAYAVEVRGVSGFPMLSFDGTTAQCYADCMGENDKDAIEATITLYQGTNRIDSWSDSGKGFLSVSGECKVQKGKAYKLILRYSVNGVEMPSVTVTKTCR